MSVSGSSNNPFKGSDFAREFRKLSNLNTSNDEVFSLIQKITASGELSTGDQVTITEVMQQRSQKSTLLTNLSRLIHESAMSVIRNLRA